MDPEEDTNQEQESDDSQSSENQDRNSPQNPSQNSRDGGKGKQSAQKQKDGGLNKLRNQFGKSAGGSTPALGKIKSLLGGSKNQNGNSRSQQLKNQGKQAAKKVAKDAAKKAVQAAAKNPYVLAVIGIVLLIIFIIILIITIISGESEALSDEAHLTITKTGPDKAVKDQTLTYQIAVSYPGVAQDITISDRIPDGTEYVSSSPVAIFDSATKTASWSLKAIIPPLADGNISNVNTTLTLNLKATKDNTTLVNIAQGTLSAAPAGGGGNVPPCTPNGSPDAEAKWQQVLQFGQKYGPIWIEFLNDARSVAQQEDYPIAVILGQGAHESARGASNMSRTKKNFFGFMAYDSNTKAARTYATAADSIKDYVKLIKGGNGGKNKKYLEAYANRSDPTKMVQLIKAGGYATDPNYVKKVTSIREFKILEGVSLPCAL